VQAGHPEKSGGAAHDCAVALNRGSPLRARILSYFGIRFRTYWLRAYAAPGFKAAGIAPDGTARSVAPF